MPAETAASAAGVVTALGSATTSWPDELWAGSVGLVDALIRTYYGIYEFTDDPGCVLRVGLGQARAAVTLSDGTRVEDGELVGTLHFWNEHLPRYTPEGPNLRWACAMRDQMRRSLCSLADYIETEPGGKFVRFAARPRCRPGSEHRKSSGSATDTGLNGYPRQTFSFLRRLHAVGESLTLWSLTRAFNPAALPRQPFMRDHHELWISRTALLRRYGRPRRQARTAAARATGA